MEQVKTGFPAILHGGPFDGRHVVVKANSYTAHFTTNNLLNFADNPDHAYFTYRRRDPIERPLNYDFKH
jgi:hypothetical protein